MLNNEQYHRPGDPLIHPHWVANHSGSPLRQRWIERLDDLGFLHPAA